jgi:hypothetical protein
MPCRSMARRWRPTLASTLRGSRIHRLRLAAQWEAVLEAAVLEAAVLEGPPLEASLQLVARPGRARPVARREERSGPAAKQAAVVSVRVGRHKPQLGEAGAAQGPRRVALLQQVEFSHPPGELTRGERPLEARLPLRVQVPWPPEREERALRILADARSLRGRPEGGVFGELECSSSAR